MTSTHERLSRIDDNMLHKMAMESLHRIIVHYGMWFSEVEHQLGMEKALEIENNVWNAGIKNQLTRLGKQFGFSMDGGIPSFISALSREEIVDLLDKLSVNWLASDGIWFQGVEQPYGMNTAKRSNDTCWTRFSPFEAYRIKQLLELPDNGGIPALKTALNYRLYAMINEQSIEVVNDDCIIFRMESCRVQTARKRRGLPDYPCKSAGMVEYPRFAEAVDPRIRTECIGCPPDDHPEEWFCAWKFTI